MPSRSPKSTANASSASTAPPSSAPYKEPKIKPDRTVVLIHGFRGAPSGLAPIAKILEESGFTTFIPKIPPFAGAGELFDYNPHTYADYIADYIAKNRLESPILIGHSMGSVIAAATASLHPEIVGNKLILLSPISKRPPFGVKVISPLSAYLPASIIDFVTTGYLFVPRNFELFSETMRITSTCSHAYPPSRKATSKATRFSTDYSIADFSLQKQVAIICGEHDRLINRRATEALARKLNAETTFLPDTGHLLNYERPAETAAAILKHLQDD